MALGSHRLNGQIADFERAPTRISTIAVDSAADGGGGSARIAEIR